ncbi:MAG: sugar ABC transporter permease [Spirochaetaceae bacterium]|nr:sugar ABC transporter permease [Spirochaetaceae bacterium]
MNKRGASSRYLNRVGWFMVAPAIILYAVFNLYPILSSLGMVTRKWQGMRVTYIGLGNFARMLNDKIFWQSLGHNFLFMGIQIPIMIMLALILAVILNQGIKHGRGALRTIFFLPCVTSLVAYSVLFRMLFQTNGLLNNVLMNLNIIQNPIGWLNDPNWAKATIMIALTWRWTGYNMVFFIVGMQNINNEIYEAAEVDGANRRQQFFRITMPLLRPVILFSVVTSISGTMQLLDEPNVLTWEGGPANATMTAALYIYRQAFVLNSDFGYATALSYVVVIITAAFAFIQMRLLGRRDQ